MTAVQLAWIIAAILLVNVVAAVVAITLLARAKRTDTSRPIMTDEQRSAAAERIRGAGTAGGPRKGATPPSVEVGRPSPAPHDRNADGAVR